MQNKLELSLLIDYYGAFLTDNQCEMLKLNCEEDFSLAEIAEQKGISRQGVRDALQRGEKILLEMEEKLGLAARRPGVHAGPDGRLHGSAGHHGGQ